MVSLSRSGLVISLRQIFVLAQPPSHLMVMFTHFCYSQHNTLYLHISECTTPIILGAGEMTANEFKDDGQDIDPAVLLSGGGGR